MKKILACLFLLLLALTSHGQGQGPESSTFGLDENDAKAVREIRYKMAQIRKTRPTVALVLSGGGAKGAATVGVLKYLEQYDFPIDMVVGTSIGGLVGAMYSLGYDAAYLDSLFRNMDWSMALSDKVDRKWVPYSRIRNKEKYLFSFPFYYKAEDYQKFLAGDAPFEAGRSRQLRIGADEGNQEALNGLVRGSILGSLPSGFVYGQNVNQVITSHTVGYSDSTDFFKLPIPFACVATDMASGRAKVWHSGSLNLAMRSTMSIPGLFAPVRTGGMVLVDGGMRNNFPVNIARQMGADIVIGVDLSDPSLKANDILNLGDIFMSSLDIFANDAFLQNINTVDVRIHPDLSGYNMLSFNAEAVGAMYQLGYEAAEQMEPQLKAIRRRLGKAHLERKAPPAVDLNKTSVLIGDIEIVGVSEKDIEYIRSRMLVQPGQKVNHQQISDDISAIFGKGSYDYVNYELRGKEEPYTLHIQCKRAPMHQFGFGARIDTEDVVSLLLNVGLNTNALRGSSLDITTRISTSPYLDLLYSYNAPRFSTFNVRSLVKYVDQSAFTYGEDQKGHSLFQAVQELFFSNMHWSSMDVKLGLRNQFMQLYRVTANQQDYSFSTAVMADYPSVFVDGRIETLDDGYFPTKGVSAGLRGELVSPVFVNGGDLFSDWYLVMAADGLIPVTFDRLTFIPQGSFRYVMGPDEAPFVYANMLGGDIRGRYLEQQIPFMGLSDPLLLSNGLAMVRLDARLRIMKNHYVSAVANVAYCFDNFANYSLGSSIWGAGVSYGYNSVAGPLKFQLFWSSVTRRVGFYLSLGYSF